MPRYRVILTRSVRSGEEAEIELEAVSPEAALEHVQQFDEDDDRLDWQPFDNENYDTMVWHVRNIDSNEDLLRVQEDYWE